MEMSTAAADGSQCKHSHTHRQQYPYLCSVLCPSRAESIRTLSSTHDPGLSPTHIDTINISYGLLASHNIHSPPPPCPGNARNRRLFASRCALLLLIHPIQPSAVSHPHPPAPPSSKPNPHRTSSPTLFSLLLPSPSIFKASIPPRAPSAQAAHRPSPLSSKSKREEKSTRSAPRGYSSLPSLLRERLEDSPLCDLKAVNLDFEARIPVPFSVFPSTYKESETQTQTQTVTQTHEELEIKLPEKKPQKPGREGQYSSFTATAAEQQLPLPPRKEQRFSEEEVRIEEHYHRPGVHHESHHYREEYRPAPPPPVQQTTQEFHDTRIHHHDTRVEIDTRHHEHLVNPIDKIERQYRQRFQPTYHREEVTVEHFPAHHHHHHSHSHVDEYTVDAQAERPRPQYKETVKVTEETIEPARFSRPQHKSKMGYYDDDGHDRYEVSEVRSSTSARRQPSPSTGGAPNLPNTVTIPCHHIRLGDFLILQGRPCQVIKISTSAATGQYRYLGVDLFTKQLHEESSFIANPAPSVVVQTMLGPVFKQYRVLDLADGQVTAMTETGDVKQGLPVIDQSNLWSRLNNAFESGRGSVRVLVLNDNGRELAVDVKVIHGSRL
ncbi:Putative large ribosomal subunit protein uL2, domain 2 [Colletotrichum destructivum]|uniref:Large ribosomal subunit protein uL2, domain 2 n=1 Tax=Colletotrichum destructivum TaxID=34406 RepID=A0AAX4IK69_9PEZI|nr:Putative large ribosomal subunit protein uL2, domain 2 [Colletotrichum destructivum]